MRQNVTFRLPNKYLQENIYQLVTLFRKMVETITQNNLTLQGKESDNLEILKHMNVEPKSTDKNPSPEMKDIGTIPRVVLKKLQLRVNKVIF